MIITVRASVALGSIEVTCSGLTIFNMASVFGGLRISTSKESLVSLFDLEPTKVVPSFHSTTAQMIVTLYGSGAGTSDWSGSARMGTTVGVSNIWHSDSSVICRTANGVGFGWSAISSILLNRGTVSGIFSYTGLSVENSSHFLLPSTGSALVSFIGTNFGYFNPSLSSVLGGTALASSFWQSSSCFVGKVAGGFPQVSYVAYILTSA